MPSAGVPVPVAGGRRYKMLSVSQWNGMACALAEDNTVECW